MHYLAKPLALAMAAGTLIGVTPAETYSSEQLALLDPTTRVAGLCGSARGSQSLRVRLALAAAVVGSEARSSTLPLNAGLGNIHFPITTISPQAQLYFNQGLGLAYGFNHAGAITSFREAQRLDPACAMCWWGEAMARGPNINAPMDANANARAFATARYAQWLAATATPAERAIADAMVKRYSSDPAADRASLDAAYADAMLAAAAAHPAIDDIGLLAAEAAMDTLPWNYWEVDGRTPKLRVGKAVQLVETVLTRNPDHPQAAHLYIHLMEAGPDPKRAEAAADRLATPLAPAAGHLVHMPAHIYFRLGRWKDSIRVNIDAARADEAYIRASGDRGLVRYGYYPHNVHFIVTSAQMAGDLGTAIRESRRLNTLLDPATSSKIAWIQAINAAPYFAAAQFALPADILRMRAPDARLPYVAGIRHYARAVARAHLRDRHGFAQEVAQLRRLRETTDFKPMVDQGVPGPDLLLLAETVARARLAFMTGNYGEAIQLYKQAITVEDKLPYMEPPFWYFPVRQSLGAALYRAGRYDEAREAFTAALAKAPNNGWALYGLASAERALGRREFAAGADAALNRAWLGNPKWLRMDRL